MANKHMPTALALLKGSPNTKRKAEKQINLEPEVKIPKPTKWLGKIGKAEFKRISKELYKLNLISELDKVALEMYCAVYERWVISEMKLRTAGNLPEEIALNMVEETTNGNIIQSPFIGMANKSLNELKGMLKEFGLTPSSRAGLRLDLYQSQESDDPFNAFLKRKLG